MEEKKKDRRVQRTRENLYKALGDLMKVKKYSKITIQDIIDEANIGRSTFYAHFETKDDLMFSRTEVYLDMLNVYIYKLIEQSSEEGRLISIEELFDHIKEQKSTIRTVFYSDDMSFFQRRAKEYWHDAIFSYIEGRSNNDLEKELPIDILVNHITNTLISMMELWINEKLDYSAHEMDQFFQKLVNPYLKGYSI